MNQNESCRWCFETLHNKVEQGAKKMLTPFAGAPLFSSHFTSLLGASGPSKMSRHRELCLSDLTPLLEQHHRGNEKKDSEREGERVRVKESYMVLSNVALTFRSGQRSKWHADRFTEGFQRGQLLVF